MAMFKKAEKALGHDNASILFTRVMNEDRKDKNGKSTGVTDADIESYKRADEAKGDINTVDDLMMHLTGRDHDGTVMAKKISLKETIKKTMLESKRNGKGSTYKYIGLSQIWTVNDIDDIYSKDETKFNDVNSALDKIVDTIFSLQEKYIPKMTEQLVQFKNGELSEENLDPVTKAWLNLNIKYSLRKRTGEHLYTFSDIDKINPNFAELKTMFKDSFSPIVIYNDDTKEISFYLITGYTDFFEDPNTEHLSQYINKDEKIKNKFQLHSSLTKEQIAKLSLLGMFVKHIDSSINIKPSSIMKLKPGAQITTFNMFNYMDELKYMVSNEHIKTKTKGTINNFLGFQTLFNIEFYKTDSLGNLMHELSIRNINFLSHQQDNNDDEDRGGKDKAEMFARWHNGLAQNEANKFIYNNDIEQIISEIISYEAKKANYSDRMYDQDRKLLKLASKAWFDLRRNGKVIDFPVRDMSTLDRHITPNYEVSDPFSQAMMLRYKEAYITVLSKLRPQIKIIDEAFLKYQKALGKITGIATLPEKLFNTLRVHDTAAELFSDVFIHEKGYSGVNNDVVVDVNTGKIHHKDNPITIEMLKHLSGDEKLKLEAAAEFGSVYMAEQLKYLTKYRFYQLFKYGDKEDEIMKLAESQIKNEWDFEHGAVFAVGNPSSEKGSIKGSLTKFSGSNAAGVEFEGDAVYTKNMPISVQYLSQIGSSNHPFVSDKRANMMGLEMDSKGRIILVDGEKNKKNLSLNLQHIFNVVAGGTIWAQEMNRFVPYYYATVSMITQFETQQGHPKLKNIKKYAENFYEYTLHKKKMMLDEKGIPIGDGKSFHFDDLIWDLNNLVVFSLMFGNYMLSSTNLTRNIANLNLKAMQNQFAGHKNMFNESDMMWAEANLALQYDKAAAVAEKQGLDLVDYSSLMLSSRHSSSKRILDTYSTTFASFMGDYLTSVTLMMAQMKHEGVWDAFNDKGEYDETKDPRWKGVNGKVLHDYTLNKLKQAGYGHEGDKLTLAYDADRVNFIRVVNSKFISGPYGETDSTELDLGVIGKAFLRFKKYSIQDYHNALSFMEKELEQFASLEVEEIDDNGVKKMVVQRKPMYFQGKLAATLKTLHAAKALATGSPDEFIALWNDPKKGAMYRENIFRICADLILVILPTLLLIAAAAGDKKKKKEWEGTYLYKVYWFGMVDAVSDMSLKNYINNLSDPFIALKNIRNLYRAAEFAFVFDFKSADREITKAFALKKHVWDKVLEPWIMEDEEDSKESLRTTTRLKK
jgi:hypothetical protein